MALSKNALLTICSLLSISEFNRLQAEPIHLDLSLSNGYRVDKISEHVDSFGSDGTYAFSDHFKIKDISLYEIGCKARLSTCSMYFRGDTYLGWGTSGHFSNRESSSFASSITKADIDSTKTQDFNVGAGYLFTLGDCIEIAPLAGLSYHSQKYKLKHVSIDSYSESELDGLRIVNRWQGPWLGVDVVLRACNFILLGGYEYHWSDWRAKRLMHYQDILKSFFSDHRKSDNVHGQVGFVDARWNYCSGWEIGFGVKWQSWEALKGKLKPRKHHGAHHNDSSSSSSSNSSSSSSHRDKVKNSKWESILFTLDLGVYF